MVAGSGEAGVFFPFFSESFAAFFFFFSSSFRFFSSSFRFFSAFLSSYPYTATNP